MQLGIKLPGKAGGKTKTKSTSSAPSKGPPGEEHGSNGSDPFTESVDISMAPGKDVNEMFEKLLVSTCMFQKQRIMKQLLINDKYSIANGCAD